MVAYHPEERFIGEVDVLIDGRKNTEYETDQHRHETTHTNNTSKYRLHYAVLTCEIKSL